MAVRTITEEEAEKVINKVFKRCYNDLEPFGRRIRTASDAKLALAESRLFGYKVNVTNEAQKESQPHRDHQFFPSD